MTYFLGLHVELKNVEGIYSWIKKIFKLKHFLMLLIKICGIVNSSCDPEIKFECDISTSSSIVNLGSCVIFHLVFEIFMSLTYFHFFMVWSFYFVSFLLLFLFDRESFSLQININRKIKTNFKYFCMYIWVFIQKYTIY